MLTPRALALVLTAAAQATAATSTWRLATPPEPVGNPAWYTNVCDGWTGKVQFVSSTWHAQLVAPDGQMFDNGIGIYYTPNTGRYGILDGSFEHNETFVFRDKIAVCLLDPTLYCYSRVLTNTIPEGADPIPYLETQCREYFRNYTPRTIPETHAITYFGYYLGEGQITRDPTTHEITHVNHAAGGVPQLSGRPGDGTNLCIHIRAAGGEADVIFNDDMKPIGAIRGGTNVIIDPANNTYFTQKSWGQPVEGLRLALTLNKAAFKSGEPILGSIWVQNVTNDTREYQPTMLGGQVLTVIDNAGKALPTIASQRPQTFAERAKSIVVNGAPARIPPGAHSIIEVNATSQYDLAAPGQYKLRFALKVPTPDYKAFPVAVTPDMPITILPK
jgi:hypothetical protein